MAGKKKGGLGKGLYAIFAENDMEDANATVTLKISEIEPNRAQPRKDFNDEALAELADSIAQHGVLQPLLVRPLLGGGYQIVAGERRWRAARMAGVSEVPVVIREMSDHEVMELALIENLQREDLTPLEEAQGYQSLIDQYGMTQEETAKRVGKSRPAVANAMRLLHLCEPVRAMVEDGRLSGGHARALLPLPAKQQETAAAAVLKSDLSVRQTELLAKKLLAETPEKPAKDPLTVNYAEEAAKELGERLGVENYYKYFKQFGLTQKTGIDLPGEAATIMHKQENVGPVELATISFGQSFQITPIQLVTTVSSIINGGTRITPHFGVEVRETDGTLVETFSYDKREEICSGETSETMQYLLEKVVSEGGGKNAKIEGYAIGGKTATSQTLPRSEHRYISSFLGFAPADDPKVLVIAIINNPKGTYYGGLIAAPVVKEIMENILPYLDKS